MPIFSAPTASIGQLSHGAHGDFQPTTTEGRPVRWGHVREIDRRAHVGTPAWYRLHQETRLQHLSAWRRLHMLRTHQGVRREANRRGVSPSSDTTVEQKVDMAKTFEQRDAKRSPRKRSKRSSKRAKS